MLTPSKIERQINNLIKYLVEKGLADDQNFAFQREIPNQPIIEVTFNTHNRRISRAFRDDPYKRIYQDFIQDRIYNVKMLDGALIQMMYIFSSRKLQRHRLSFFSAPHLEEFQNNQDVYLYDEIYADVVGRNIVPFPLRFDYDAREGHYKELTHPKSHLSLGQYRKCRIPVSAPVPPFWFIDFILRNFYNTAFTRHSSEFPKSNELFDKSILSSEENIIHIVIPA